MNKVKKIFFILLLLNISQSNSADTSKKTDDSIDWKPTPANFQRIKNELSKLTGWDKRTIAKENKNIKELNCAVISSNVNYATQKQICSKFVCPLGRMWNYAPTSLAQEASIKCACICQEEGHKNAYNALRSSLDFKSGEWNVLDMQ